MPNFVWELDALKSTKNMWSELKKRVNSKVKQTGLFKKWIYENGLFSKYI